MSGHQRLACDELACVDAVRAGLVSFEPVAGGSRTDVIFDLESDGETGPSPEVLGQNLARDLVVFKDYVEGKGKQVGRPTRAEDQARLEDEERHNHEPVQGHVGLEDKTSNFRNHWPR